MTVEIEINGQALQVEEGKMIIEVADAEGITIPRFCYHKDLSVAANCRMCLVEVEQSNKPLPACATPVSPGMKVRTDSEKAKLAQRGVMEFLLINHPLDCPVCDQGGECELQDLSMGYGAGVGRYSEAKRVVEDKNIGALVKTDMTRCIHCTRCVRFGQEVAGIKELGATGRGEHTEIGTYIAQSLSSELSGNIIDLCPVGALTSKPFRYQARAWELVAHQTCSPHDGLATPLEVHTRRQQVMRIVPHQHQDGGESWISDRDRFSYLGLQHDTRADKPMIKRNGRWQEVDWQTALAEAHQQLANIISEKSTEQVAGLVAPTSTVEEGYIFQKWLRGLGIENIDHRLRHQQASTVASSAALKPEQLTSHDQIVVIGSRLRQEQPILSQRLRRASQQKSHVHTVGFYQEDLLMPVDSQWVGNSDKVLLHLAAVLKQVLAERTDEQQWQAVLNDIVVTEQAIALAKVLQESTTGLLIVGEMINHHPQANTFHQIIAKLAALTQSKWIALPNANSIGLLQANVLPQQLEKIDYYDLAGYVLLAAGLEDFADPAAMRQSLQAAKSVIAMTAYVTEDVLSYATVILPIAPWTETSGTVVGIDRQWQSMRGVIPPKGDSRPCWKVLRVLANLAELEGFDYIESTAICNEAQARQAREGHETIAVPSIIDIAAPTLSQLEWIAFVPMYQTDTIVRRSQPLSDTPNNQQAMQAVGHSSTAAEYGIADTDWISIRHGEQSVSLSLRIDDKMAPNCILMPMSVGPMQQFARPYCHVSIRAQKKVA